MTERRHVALVTNTGWSMVRYRGELLRGLRERGWRVTAIADFSANDMAGLREFGVEPVRLPVEGAGRNALHDLGYLVRLAGLLRHLRPDLVHTFSVKPVVYGSLAAKLAGVPGIVATVTGGGRLRAGESDRVQGLIRRLYHVALRGRPVVVFQNRDDLELFVADGLVARAHTTYIAGSGVDTQALAPDLSISPSSRTRFVMASRMLWTKGVADFVAAARLLKPRHPQAEFSLFGGSAEDYGSKNPDFIPKAWLEALNQEGIVRWHGFTAPAVVEAAMRAAAAVVLLSEAEGAPRTLIEAAAAGAPIITTDAPGCRDTVIAGKSGFLCPLNAPEQVAAAMARLLEEPDLIATMGRAGRDLAVARFDRAQVIDATLALYEDRLAAAARPHDACRRS